MSGQPEQPAVLCVDDEPSILRALRRVFMDEPWELEFASSGEEGLKVIEERAFDLIALDEALRRLIDVDEFMVRVVELRFFGGLSTQETADVLQVSTRKVERDWKTAKGWLRKEIE